MKGKFKLPIYKLCPKCGEKIQYSNKYCIKCKVEVDKKQKESYKEYKRNRIDVKEQRFYSSNEWINLREYIKAKYMFVDVFSYYTEGKIVECKVVHHIIETKEDWNLRLNENNLICLSNSSHKLIHNLYNKDSETKHKTQELLKKINERFKEEFGL